MNVVFSVRFFVVSMTTICLVLLPRALYYFGLRAEALDILLSPWATFIILIFAGCLLTYTWLKNIKLAIPTVLVVIAAAAMLTFYFCQLSLPW